MSENEHETHLDEPTDEGSDQETKKPAPKRKPRKRAPAKSRAAKPVAPQPQEEEEEMPAPPAAETAKKQPTSRVVCFTNANSWSASVEVVTNLRDGQPERLSLIHI